MDTHKNGHSKNDNKPAHYPIMVEDATKTGGVDALLLEVQSRYAELGMQLPKVIADLEAKIEADTAQLNRYKAIQQQVDSVNKASGPTTTKTEDQVPKITKKNFGKLLREARENQNMSQRQLGMKVGKPQSEISRFERTGSIPDEGIFNKITKVLRLPKMEISAN